MIGGKPWEGGKEYENGGFGKSTAEPGRDGVIGGVGGRKFGEFAGIPRACRNR
jgi:hypothetical protein